MRERHEIALRLRAEGATFQKIGEALRVSPSRANEIYKRALVVREEEDIGMGSQAIRIVRHYRSDLAELAALADRDPSAAMLILIQEPNCLRRHALEILAWLAGGNREKP